MNNVRKNIIMVTVIALMGMLIAGGTYAWLTARVNVTNGSYNVGTHCFLIDYNINNTDGSQNITGTMFPSSGPSKGLSGRVGLKISDSCDVSGIGTLKLHINSGTSTKFTTVGVAHCENTATGETLPDYKTSSACSGHGTWTSVTTPLKYAIYDNSAATGTPLSKGYIESSDINNDKEIYTGITLNRVQKYFYIFLWLDGYMTDNTYVDLPFNGYISASATQSETVLPMGYQQVEYIESNGGQYITTSIIPNNTTGVYAKILSKNTSSDLVYFGTRPDTDSRFWVGNNNNYMFFGWNTNTHNTKFSSTNPNYLSLNFLNDRKEILNTTIVKSDLGTLNTQSYPLTIFAGNDKGTINYKSSIQLYELKISEGSKVTYHFVPCYRTNDTAIGLYDIMHGVFYTNSGSGSFIKGKNV